MCVRYGMYLHYIARQADQSRIDRCGFGAPGGGGEEGGWDSEEKE